MAYKTFIVAALCVCMVSGYRVAREEPKDQLKEVFDNAGKIAQEVGDHIAKMLNIDQNKIPSWDNVATIVKNQTSEFVNKADDLRKQLDEQVKQVTDKNVQEQFQAWGKQVQDTVAQLRAEVDKSTVSEKAGELQAKLQEGIKKLVDGGKDLAKSLEPQVTSANIEIEKLTKKIVDESVGALNSLQDKIHTETHHHDGH